MTNQTPPCLQNEEGLSRTQIWSVSLLIAQVQIIIMGDPIPEGLQKEPASTKHQRPIWMTRSLTDHMPRLIKRFTAPKGPLIIQRAWYLYIYIYIYIKSSILRVLEQSRILRASAEAAVTFVAYGELLVVQKQQKV